MKEHTALGNMGVLMSALGTPLQHEIPLNLFKHDIQNRPDEQIQQLAVRASKVRDASSCIALSSSHCQARPH